MAKIINDRAQERSTYTVVGEFFEKSSDPNHQVAITPNTGVWSLQDTQGNYINGRVDVPFTPAPSVVVTLFGDDLALGGDYPEYRVLTFEGTYDTVFGTNLPYRIQLKFQIENLID